MAGWARGDFFGLAWLRRLCVTTLPATEHLLLRLRTLNRALRAAVTRQGRASARLFRPEVTPLCVTEEQVQRLLSDVETLDCRPLAEAGAELTPEEQMAEEKLRERCAASGVELPYDCLTQSLNLSPFEQEAVLLCAAVELDRSYERIYAYILDDLNRRFPCIELLCSLTAISLTERCARRETLGRYGKLRRTGVLQTFGEPATELRQELRLAPGLFAYLAGVAGDMTGLFRDQSEVLVPSHLQMSDLPPGIDAATIARFGRAVRERSVAVLGIFGPRQSGQSQAASAIAAAAAMPLRRCVFTETLPSGVTHEQRICESIQAATALRAILWVNTEPLTEPGSEGLRGLGALLADHLAASQVPIILTGTHPWRPTALLEARPYADLELEAPTFVQRQRMWKRELPEVSTHQRDDLAARFRIHNSELRAVARVARTQALLASNGRPAAVSDQLEAACAAVTRKNSYHFATVVKPRRGPNDLILPPDLHTQVLEVGQFFKAWPRVAEDWGFGRLVTGEGGIKALFTGDSGTGKTLAAEVIAGELRMPLLKIDLSRVVSKWVGETEKHLEQVFGEAEDSNAVLFFDEADSLFGRRGEVRHGIDRYANMEVSYLLQRLEACSGLVILASNLANNIDQAFTRRFQIVLHFPRPELSERRRIWELAFSYLAPLEDEIDFDLLAQLDLTGAGIVGAAQTAALLAMGSVSKTKWRNVLGDDGSLGNNGNPTDVVISVGHVVQGIARQYRREARLLTPSELGPYAPLLQR
jgi:hypothetical protein